MTELFTIPALKWEWFEETEIHGWRAEICGFGAMVYQELLRGVPPDWTVLASSQPTEFRASPEEGKQLAEKHWREYVKQALKPFAFTSSALRPVAQALYDKGCGHVMDVEEIEALLGHALAECVEAQERASVPVEEAK